MSECSSCGPEREVVTSPGFRRAWRAHPHYPDQLLLVASHESFRRLSRELVTRARERNAGWRLHVELLFRLWHRGMRGHEGYEEHKLYPFLVRRYQTSMASLVGDHRALHELRDEVYRALAKAEEVGDDPVADAAALTALERYDALLNEHLDREEATVIPLLLDLPRDEFVKYTRSSIERLLADLPARACC